MPSEPHSSVARLTGLSPGQQRVDQITADPARHLGEGMRDVRLLAPPERKQVTVQGKGDFAVPAHADRLPSPSRGGDGGGGQEKRVGFTPTPSPSP